MGVTKSTEQSPLLNPRLVPALGPPGTRVSLGAQLWEAGTCALGSAASSVHNLQHVSPLSLLHFLNCKEKEAVKGAAHKTERAWGQQDSVSFSPCLSDTASFCFSLPGLILFSYK